MNTQKRFHLHHLVLATLVAGTVACSPSQTDTRAENKHADSQTQSIWPKLDIQVKADPQIEARVSSLLTEMTLEQKVAQIIQPEIRDITVEDMRRYGFGSYLNGGGSFPAGNKHATVEEWIALAEAMYQASVDDSLDGSTIPTMWGTDAVHGHNNVIGATLFPHNIGLGAMRNPDLIEKIANATAREVMATGIDWIFAPTVATARDDRWGRTYESYSEDPAIVKDYAAAIVTGLQGVPGKDFLNDEKVISTVKHFVGDGGTEKGDDQGNNIADEHTLFAIHAQGYVGGLSAGAQSVMASFNSWHGKKIHGSQYLLTDVLKDQMGFDGFVVGDWNGHGQIDGCSNDNCPAALNAGLDVYMVPTQAWRGLMQNTIAQVQSGQIPMARLDDAVARVLRVKLRAGLFEKPSPANRPLAGKTDIIGNQAHREIAAQAVRESLVLLKNNNRLLPLSPALNVLVAGDGAHNIGKQSGGWTITWQGTGNTNEDFPGGTSIYDGIAEQVSNAGGSVTLSVDGQFDGTPDVAIVVFGEEPYAEGTGDLDNLDYQRGNKRDLALLQSLKARNIPVVSVFLSGRPMWVNAEINASDAFIAAWLPGSEGHAVADLLFTDAAGNVQHDFTGTLSFSWPNSPNQATLNVGDDNYDPLFPYGYGLTFEDDVNLAASLTETFSASDDTLTDKVLFNQSTQHPWVLGAAYNNGMLEMNSNTFEADGLSVRTIDRLVQEDALQITWQPDSPAWFGVLSVFAEDLRAYKEANAFIQFDYQVDTDVSLHTSMNCAGDCPAIITLSLRQGDWQTASLPLSCFADKGVSFGQTTAPLLMRPAAPATVNVSNIAIRVPTEGVSTAPCKY